MQYNKNIFSEFKQLSDELDFKFVLLLVPELKNTDSLDPWIRNTAPNEFGFEVIDLFDEFIFRGVDLPGLRILPDGGCHFNEKGHRLVAEIIAARLPVLIK